MNTNKESLKKLKVCINKRIPSFIVGPAGSGKTTVVKNIATEMSLPYYSISVSNQTTVSAIFGFVDASGTYRPSLFRIAYEKGGVFLMDEIDAGNANTLSAINQAIENGICGFPDGKMVNAHKDFVFVCSGNTVGTGANKKYIGRNQLDSASLDRFCQIDWEYDEDLEERISENPFWVKRVQAFRTIASQLGIGLIISPRASKNGSILINEGIPLREVEKSVIFKGQVDRNTQDKLISLVNQYLNTSTVPVIEEEVVKENPVPELPKNTSSKVKKTRTRKSGKRNVSEVERRRRAERMRAWHEENRKRKAGL